MRASRVQPTVGGTAVQGVERPFTTDLAPGTTAYFGFDLKRFANGAGLIWGMYLDEPGRAPDGSPFVNGSPQNLVIHDIGSNPPVVNSTLHANILTGGVSSAEGIVTDGVFHRVVAKLEFDAGSVAGAEKLSVWLDPVNETDTPVIIKDDQELGTSNSLNGFLDQGMALGIYAREVFAEPLFALDRLNLTTDFASSRDGLLDNGGVPTLSFGHQRMLEIGRQLEPFSDVGDPGTTTFDPVRWEQSHFTAIDFLDRVHPGSSHMPTGLPADIPWSRLVPLAQTGGNVESAEVPFLGSLHRLSLGDELLPNVQANLNTMEGQANFIHNTYPGVLAHTNLSGSQVADPATGNIQPSVRNYLSQVKPDMIVVNQYPYIDPSHPNFNAEGGSPTFMYTVFERVRQLGLEGHDGSGDTPIPAGVITQAFVGAGPGTVNAEWDRAASESEIRQQYFAAWAFGFTTAKPFIYDNFKNNGNLFSVMFNGDGTDSPTATFDHLAETNRQSLNLGPALVRLITTDTRMIMGEHMDVGIVNNTTPMAVSTWDAAADPFITSISAVNLGTKNDGLRGDVIVGYFQPLDESLADDTYFIIVNGLSDVVGSAADTAQQITVDFDCGTSGIDSLQRLSRNTGQVELVQLQMLSDSLYRMDLTLEGGTGDLFKFNNGASFVGDFGIEGDFNASGSVELGDLNVVLFNWNSNSVPSGWVNQIPSGTVGITQLNTVLFN